MRGELWIVNCAQAKVAEYLEASMWLAPAGGILNCGTGETSRTGATIGTNGTGRTGRELWIGHKLQACASGGIPIYNDKNLEPIGVKMYAIDQNGNVIVDVTIDNGHLQKHKECGCGY